MVEDRGPILHESGLDLLLQEGMVEDGDPLWSGFWVPAPTRSQVVIRVFLGQRGPKESAILP